MISLQRPHGSPVIVELIGGPEIGVECSATVRVSRHGKTMVMDISRTMPGELVELMDDRIGRVVR